MFKKAKSWSYVSLINNIYQVVITMTTTGYGDFVPYTWMGKVNALITALWGGFIISLMVVSVNGIFSLSPKQKEAFEKLIRVRYAAKLIIAAMRLHVAKQKLFRQNNNTSQNRVSTTSRQTTIHEFDIEKYVHKFHKHLKKFKDVSKSVKEYREKQETNSKITDGLDAVNKRFQKQVKKSSIYFF